MPRKYLAEEWADEEGFIYYPIAEINFSLLNKDEIEDSVKWNLQHLKEIDDKAKKFEVSNVVFRYFTTEKNATYQIINYSVDKNQFLDKILIHFCKDTNSDNHTDELFGQECWIDALQAIKLVNIRDTIEQLGLSEN